MTAPPLHLSLTAQDQPGRYTLASGSTSYPLEFRPDTDVTLGDLLRRLPRVLVGDEDPAKQLAPILLLHEIGTRLWKALLPDTAPLEARDGLARELRTGITPLLLTLPQSLSALPWELLCDPESLDDTGFIVRQRPFVRLISGGSDLQTLA